MKSCKYIDTTLVFSNQNISPCYSCFQNDVPQYIEDDKQTDFKERKQEIIKELNSNSKFEFPCKKCCHFQEDYDDTIKYSLIIFSFWDSAKPEYNIEEIITNLYNQDLIQRDNLTVEFHSSDIRNFRIFNRIIKIFEKNGYKEINFVLNNIIYHKAIEKILEKGKGSLSLIFDYKNNKNIVYLNHNSRKIKQYLEKAKDKKAIKIYYTLDKNNKDTKLQIEQFIKQMYIIGINFLSLRLNNDNIIKWLNEPVPLKNCPKNLDKIILHFFELSKKYCFYSDMNYKEQNIVFNKIFKTKKILSFKYKIKQFLNSFRRKDEI